MGLLERILARLDRIESELDIESDAETVVATTTTPALPVTPATPLAPAASGDINEHGIPWSAEFHAATKTKNQDGHWKGKKGVDKAALEAYHAQFKAGTVAPVVAATPVVPVAPAVPATPGLPPVTPPAVPATPSVPVVAPSPDHLEAVKNIQSLTNDYKVAYPLIVSSILAKHGANDFQSCNPQFHGQIKADSKYWVEKLAEIDQAVEVLDSINNKTGGTHGLPGHVATVLTQAAGTAVIAEIPFDKLADTATAISGFAKQWDDYCVATTGAGYL